MNPRLLWPVVPPSVILVLAALAVAAGPKLPPSLSGLTVVGPYFMLVLGAVIGAWFNRGRAFVALASLLAAYAGYDLALGLRAGSFAPRAVYTAFAILVPLNFLIALVFAERGVTHHRNYRWLLLAAAEILLVAWIAAAGRSSLSGTAWYAVLDHWLLNAPPTPIAGRLLFAAAFVAALFRAWPDLPSSEPHPLDVGIAGSLIGFFIACEWIASPGLFGAFMSASGLILLVSLLQESHRLAFHDELTGLPGRRALQERVSGLGPAFAVAMVDVDHFKEFNDTHGHHIGDQVLKLVAARLAEIGGGGTAYRYGGEEFCVLFPNRRLNDVLPHLENIRARIENYEMMVRGASRPKDPEAGSKMRAPTGARPVRDKLLSVTVSVGAAERDGSLTTPAQVLRAADKALYRAKNAGRNRVSR